MMAIRPLRTEIEFKLKHKVLKRVGYTQGPITVGDFRVYERLWSPSLPFPSFTFVFNVPLFNPGTQQPLSPPALQSKNANELTILQSSIALDGPLRSSW